MGHVERLSVSYVPTLIYGYEVWGLWGYEVLSFRGTRSRAADPQHGEEPAEVVLVSGEDAPWTLPWKGVLDTSTLNMLKRWYLFTGIPCKSWRFSILSICFPFCLQGEVPLGHFEKIHKQKGKQINKTENLQLLQGIPVKRCHLLRLLRVDVSNASITALVYNLKMDIWTYCA